MKTAYPNVRIDADATLNLWYALYCDVDFEVAKKATEHIIRTKKFFPNHCEFGEAIQRIQYLESIPKLVPKSLPAHTENETEDILAQVDAMWEDD